MLELLVVIAIIGVLVALTVPALNRARERAYKAVCQSRLWQIGLGFHWYISDFREQMPPVHGGYYVCYKTSSGDRQLSGIGYLYEYDYVSLPQILFCPRTAEWLQPGAPDTLPVDSPEKWWPADVQRKRGGRGTGTNRCGYWTWFSTYNGRGARGLWQMRYPEQAWLSCFNDRAKGPDMNHGRLHALYADLSTGPCSDGAAERMQHIGFWWSRPDFGCSQFRLLDRKPDIPYGDHDSGHGNDPDHWDEDNPAANPPAAHGRGGR